MKIKRYLAFVISVLLISGWVYAGSTYEIKIKVDGLACPFCAYGLEKKLEDIEGLSSLKILVDEGYAIFQFPYGKIPNLKELKKSVKKGGFTPKDIFVKVSGTIKIFKDKKLLSMNGLKASFILKGEPKAFKEGLKVEIQGKLREDQQKGHGEHPLILEVTSWKKD